MPANLTPEYHDAEERFKAAETVQERIAALEEMLRVIPKHKGTEKMQADLRRRLSQLRKESQKKSGPTSKRPFYYIEKEGIGRGVVWGPPNAGKSSLVAAVTNADVEVTDFPFATRVPVPGMMQFEDVQIQLVDMPPLAAEVYEPWQMAVFEQAPVGILVFDVNDPFLLDQTEYVLERLQSRDLKLPPDPQSRLLILGNKVDAPQGTDNYEGWRELYAGKFSSRPFSVRSQEDLEWFRAELFRRLRVVRVYTKPRAGKPRRDGTPFVLAQGSTVLDAAAAIHKDLVDHFKYARIWGGGIYDGQMVERDYVLQDGDIVEIHT
ncbi:MAG TPA: TGS domain-containing protein [Acidobacteriota bacterium]|nr:TGS domain-containing protein [Acidobacteriota bacterium]